MEASFANQTLLTDKEEELELDKGTENSNIGVCELDLVGRLLTDRQINFSTKKHCLAGLWRLGRGVTIKEIKTI